MKQILFVERWKQMHMKGVLSHVRDMCPLTKLWDSSLRCGDCPTIQMIKCSKGSLTLSSGGVPECQHKNSQPNV